MAKVVVTVEPEGRKIEAVKGLTLLGAFEASGVSMRSECGGRGVCGKCKVLIKEQPRINEPTDQEMKLLTSAEIALGLRLACQTKLEGDLTVMLPIESRVRQRQIQVEGTTASFKLNPAVRKLRAQPPPPSLSDTRSDSERLLDFLKENYGLSGMTISYEALKKLPRVLRTSEWDLTVAVWDGQKVIDVEAWDTTQLAYGLSVDIGTSKIVGQLVLLDNGQVVATSSIENPQIGHGEDVISRITFASSGENGLAELKSLVVKGINDVILTLCEQGGVRPEHIYEMTFVGNSVMHHILLGIQPSSVAVAPYVIVVKGPLNLKPKDLELQMNRGGNIHVLPLVTGFVGSDSVADVLATGIHKSEELSLLIDIGTNTEVNLGNRDGILCCSCASGPAFEGAHIRDGMKAVQGSIERVRVDPRDYSVSFEVIGGGKPVGICGSAMIDILAEMLKCNLINWTGRINGEASTERIRRVDGSLEFVIAWSGETGKDEDIAITQRDVRELQLAKAAIYTGCSVLMKRKGVSARDIGRVYLAGAFGNYIEPENAKRVGLIPDVESGRVMSVGNTALSGARMALLSMEMRREAAEISKNLTYVELGVESGFHDEFISATYLPHKELCLFSSVRKMLDRN